MTVDVLVPYFEDTPGRRELWEFNRGLWERVAGARVYVGDDPAMEEAAARGERGRFNRGRARNRAARLGAEGGSEWILAYDSDAAPPEEAVLEEAVRRAAGGGVGWAPLFAACVIATPAGTRAYMRGELGEGEWVVGESAYRWFPFAIGPTVVRRDVFGSVGGYDERFVGWGVEDLALRAVLKAVRGEPWGHPHAWCLSLTLDPEDVDGKAREGAVNSELYKREYVGLDRGRALDLIWRIRDSGCE